jgi:hypothetical protein
VGPSGRGKIFIKKVNIGNGVSFHQKIFIGDVYEKVTIGDCVRIYVF